jgi:hypothetical protein
VAYGDAWETELFDLWHRWSSARWSRDWREEFMDPDDRLDELGWSIFYYGVMRGADPADAAKLAMDGTYWQRLRVEADLQKRHALMLRRRYAELNPHHAGLGVFDTHAPDQLGYWREHGIDNGFVYFIQEQNDGPIKIGYSARPEKRLSDLQTGNPDQLHLRHVIPGDRQVERQLHRRFEPARIRLEWFGGEYLPIILAFAGGLADEVIYRHDGSGTPPTVSGAEVRSDRELLRIHRDIERMWLNGDGPKSIAQILFLDVDEVRRHLKAMRASPLYDVNRPGGFWWLMHRSPRAALRKQLEQ